MNKSEKKQYEKDKINVSRFYRKEHKEVANKHKDNSELGVNFGKLSG